MSSSPTRIEHVETGKPIDAELHDLLTLDDVLEAAAKWMPTKIQIVRELLARAVPQNVWPQALHWNWVKKAAALQPYAPGPFSPYALFGLKAEDQWQGLLLGCCVGHQTRLAPTGRDLVYIDYVESAPWNLSLAAIEQQPRFKGIGGQLFELAVRWSDDLGFRGRVGLHSLPQSEGFYRGFCAMEDVGPDANYQNLRYFELDEAHAKMFLEEDEHA